MIKIINDTIEEYKTVLRLIDSRDNYPYTLDSVAGLGGKKKENIYLDDETFRMIEIMSISSLAYFEYAKFIYLFDDHHYLLVKQSPTNKKSAQPEALFLYPHLRDVVPSEFGIKYVKHSYSNTLPALSNWQATVNRCLNTTYKKYWEKKQYDIIQEICQIFNRDLDALIELEKERLDIESEIFYYYQKLAEGKSIPEDVCYDVLDCPKYDEIADTQIHILNTMSKDRKEAYTRKNKPEAALVK